MSTKKTKMKKEKPQSNGIEGDRNEDFKSNIWKYYLFHLLIGFHTISKS